MRVDCKRVWLMLLVIAPVALEAQNAANGKSYGEIAEKITKAALRTDHAYQLLREVTALGPRLSGSPQAAAAVELTRQMMARLQFANVRLQPIMVPHWVRGPSEEAAIINSPSQGNVALTVCALGGSIATPELGLAAEVVEVKSFEELRALGKKAAGKIIFFNQPFDPAQFETFAGYGGAVNQRGSGAIEAAKAGGVAALVRSMTPGLDDFPHTGGMRYADDVPKIPAAAISTLDAELLSKILAHDKAVNLRLKLTCQTLIDAPSANVLGELLGSEKPEEVIVIGGHLDSWDKGTGAHDDGAGCVQSIEAVRLLKMLDLKPKRTIRAVMFMNEENGLRGGIEYAREAREKKEQHVAAIESDRGGFAPRGFSVESDSTTWLKIAAWRTIFESIGAERITRGGSGADISVLVRDGVPGLGLVPESHRYFDYHHSDNDTIDKVHPRELQLGAAAMAIMAYLISEEF
ncbi:MAG: M28 family peptidase [candidate division KSB1 bacterium]